jgi:hypothetical protein
MRNALSFLWKLPLIGLAFLGGVPVGRGLAGELGLAAPLLPAGADATVLLPHLVCASLLVAPVLAFLARGLPGDFELRWLALAGLSLVACPLSASLPALTGYGSAELQDAAFMVLSCCPSCLFATATAALLFAGPLPRLRLLVGGGEGTDAAAAGRMRHYLRPAAGGYDVPGPDWWARRAADQPGQGVVALRAIDGGRLLPRQSSPVRGMPLAGGRASAEGSGNPAADDEKETLGLRAVGNVAGAWTSPIGGRSRVRGDMPGAPLFADSVLRWLRGANIPCRLAGAVLAGALVYYATGRLETTLARVLGPADAMLAEPDALRSLLFQLLHSALLVAAAAPLVITWRQIKRALWLTLGGALWVLTGLVPLFIHYWHPWQAQVASGLTSLLAAFLFASLLVPLLAGGLTWPLGEARNQPAA